MTAIRAITPGMEQAWIDAGSPSGVRELGEFTSHFLQHQFVKPPQLNPAPPPRKSILCPLETIFPSRSTKPPSTNKK